MATPQDKLNQILEHLNEIEIAEVIDFAEFLSEKRTKTLDDAFDTVEEKEELLSQEDLKDLEAASIAESVSYNEMWGNL